LDFPVLEFLTSNFVDGFTAAYSDKEKKDYILNGGTNGIMSSSGMIVIGLLSNRTPFGFSCN
jgi:hypothetical protein